MATERPGGEQRFDDPFLLGLVGPQLVPVEAGPEAPCPRGGILLAEAAVPVDGSGVSGFSYSVPYVIVGSRSDVSGGVTGAPPSVGWPTRSRRPRGPRAGEVRTRASSRASRRHGPRQGARRTLRASCSRRRIARSTTSSSASTPAASNSARASMVSGRARSSARARRSAELGVAVAVVSHGSPPLRGPGRCCGERRPRGRRSCLS